MPSPIPSTMCWVNHEALFCYVLIKQLLIEFLFVHHPSHLPQFFFIQNAPLTEQQQAAIATLSHAVAERPFPAKLVSFILLLLTQIFKSGNIMTFNLIKCSFFFSQGNNFHVKITVSFCYSPMSISQGGRMVCPLTLRITLGKILEL